MSTPKLHGILKGALEAADPADHPPGPHHGGGPTPVCPALGQIEIALWCAGLVADRVPKQERPAFQAIVKAVSQYLADPSTVPDAEWAAHAHGGTMRGKEADTYLALGAVSKDERGDSVALSIARRSAGAAALFARKKPDVVAMYTKSAASKVVKLLKETPAPSSADPERPSTVTEFIAALDVKILRLECAAAIQQRTKQPAPTIASVERRIPDAKGKATYFLARLADGSYGVLAQIEKRWTWRVGHDRAALEALLPER
jgi:hypothetical protein